MRFMTPVSTLTLVVVLAAAALGGLALRQATAHAQTPPAIYFGTGLELGDEVEAFIGVTSCGTSTADAAGEWVIVIATNAPCSPSEGAKVSFTLNGKTAEEAQTWAGGGTPESLDTGMALTAPPGRA